jgi:hypothetical protein
LEVEVESCIDVVDTDEVKTIEEIEEEKEEEEAPARDDDGSTTWAVDNDGIIVDIDAVSVSIVIDDA